MSPSLLFIRKRKCIREHGTDTTAALKWSGPKLLADFFPCSVVGNSPADFLMEPCLQMHLDCPYLDQAQLWSQRPELTRGHLFFTCSTTERLGFDVEMHHLTLLLIYRECESTEFLEVIVITTPKIKPNLDILKVCLSLSCFTAMKPQNYDKRLECSNMKF